jgi:hypothetical protein
MSRKGCRQITIEGRRYLWRASYGDSWKDGHCIPLRLVIALASPQPGQHLRVVFRSGRGEVWYLDDQAVTPAVVRRVIEGALRDGWRPGESGLPDFELDGQPFIDAELLRGKSAPELRGTDWLRVLHRLEREIKVDLRGLDFRATRRHVGDVAMEGEPTAGDLWAQVAQYLSLVAALYREHRLPEPQMTWDGFAGLLAEELGVPQDRIHPESRLGADLGMGAGLAE